MANDGADLEVVLAANPVDLLDQAAIARNEARVQSVALAERRDIRHPYPDVQVVRAGLQDVAAGARCLVGNHRVARRVEQHRRQAIEQRVRSVSERRARSLESLLEVLHAEHSLLLHRGRQVELVLAMRVAVVDGGGSYA